MVDPVKQQLADAPAGTLSSAADALFVALHATLVQTGKFVSAASQADLYAHVRTHTSVGGLAYECTYTNSETNTNVHVKAVVMGGRLVVLMLDERTGAIHKTELSLDAYVNDAALTELRNAALLRQNVYEALLQFVVPSFQSMRWEQAFRRPEDAANVAATASAPHPSLRINPLLAAESRRAGNNNTDPSVVNVGADDLDPLRIPGTGGTGRGGIIGGPGIGGGAGAGGGMMVGPDHPMFQGRGGGGGGSGIHGDHPQGSRYDPPGPGFGMGGSPDPDHMQMPGRGGYNSFGGGGSGGSGPFGGGGGGGYNNMFM